MNSAVIRPYPRSRRLPVLAVPVLALAVCGAAPYPAPQAESAAAPEDATAAMEKALGDAVKRQTWKDLRIDTECRMEEAKEKREREGEEEEELRSATIFASGAGIWDGKRQLVMKRSDVLSLLKELAAAGFPRMRETYGEVGDEIELICRLRLDLDGASKQVHQLSTGPRSPDLMRLAGRILAAAEEAADKGPTASSITDALEKIARGKLAPELLTVNALRQSETPTAPDRWLLTLAGGKLMLSTQQPGEEPRSVRLAPAEVTALARQLAAAHLEELPANLWAPEYTNLEIHVLDQGRSLLARRFAGKTPSTHGELQQRFDRLWEVIAGLRGRLAAPAP